MNAVDEVLMLEDGEVGGNRCGDSLNAELTQSAQRATNRSLTIGAPANELANEVVVVLADGVARLVAAIPAGSKTSRRNQRGDVAGGGEELALRRIFRVDANLNRVASKFDRFLSERKRKS
ncbi:unannotated protein [freshwater metagenome]|uniref:Unannotated protein n=1 Tax=freshwater metagenome TaxID=449393 RepID=A0A6J6LEU4_9ZZZZ